MNDDIIEKNLFSLFSGNYFVDTHSIHLNKKNSMCFHNIFFAENRSLDKSVQLKIILVSLHQNMLWVLKRTVSLRRFF